MLKGLQTHFDGVILGPEKCQQLADIGVQLGRIDGMSAPAASIINDQVGELALVGIKSYVTIKDPSLIRDISPVYGIEYLNEPDGRIHPEDYMAGLYECAIECEKAGHDCYGPTVSNLIRTKVSATGAELRGIEYLQACNPYPDRMKASVHRYGDDKDVKAPHKGFISREHEVMAMHRAVGLDRPFGVSESGWATYGGLSEEMAAYNIAWEWKFWAERKALFLVLYQIGDGPSDIQSDHYGLFRYDGTVKEAIARTFK